MSLHINAWFVAHYRSRQSKSGTLAVARQLRKQGVPLWVAIAVLAQRAV